MYFALYVKYPLFLSDLNKPWISWTNFIKIRPVGADLFHADRGTDRHDEANNRSSQFFPAKLAKVKNQSLYRPEVAQRVPGS